MKTIEFFHKSWFFVIAVFFLAVSIKHYLDGDVLLAVLNFVLTFLFAAGPWLSKI
ncbi:MAG: hypothetical protein KC516_03990 [Nanoarchaeota archaeon]|nr:hypothetical protein [Nanoarchaeota archaeon]